MKFVITKNILENVIASMQPFLEKKDSSAITSHIYLETQNNKLIVKATDYEIGLETSFFLLCFCFILVKVVGVCEKMKIQLKIPYNQMFKR